MSDSERDPTVIRAIDELRRLPAADREAARRVAVAAAAARAEAPADEPTQKRPNRRLIRAWTVVGVAAASVIALVATRDAWQRGWRAPTSPGGTAVSKPAAMSLAASTSSEAQPVVQQFVFAKKDAHKVAVIGDFNRWNPSADPMTRAENGELWSASVSILPGRHMYAFMVDDSLMMLDPRAPKAKDPDLGGDGSVVIVGRP
jgi:hypothetical protein